MKILIIPEDFRKDQYILKPIIEAMIQYLGKNHAKIKICRDPLLGGINEALKIENIRYIIERYPTIDLFLLCVDRDGNANRKQTLINLEQQAQENLNLGQLFLAENAWQELEVWVLAGHDLPTSWKWQDIRQEMHPKENYFEPFSQAKNCLQSIGEGRKKLSQEAAHRYGRIRQLCPEDILNLENRIKIWLA